jgi:hypothetical protein
VGTYCASSDVWLDVKRKCHLTADFTQTMEIKCQRIINGKTRRDRITDMTFAEVTFQYLLTELEEK